MSRGRPRGGAATAAVSGGGAGRGRGKRNAGPENTWDSEPAIESSANKPEPLFPNTAQSLPLALTSTELDRVNKYRHFRSLVRDGPLYTVLAPSQRTDRDGKLNKRAGFDPFEGMPSYSKRYQKPKRQLPDLSTRPYHLKYFPKELWSTLDPERLNPAWETLGPSLPDPPSAFTAASRKRRAGAVSIGNSSGKRRRIDISSEDEEEADIDIAPASQRRVQRREKDPLDKADAGQRKGLEAEDDYGPDTEQVNEDDPEGQEVVEDSVFEESDDGAGNDYNAESYFDAGDDDDFEDGGGGDDDGGVFLS